MIDAEAIFRAALERVNPLAMIERMLEVDRNELRASTEHETVTYDLAFHDRIIVTGMGKATARMALGLENVLGDRIALGLISVKPGHVERHRKIRALEAGHPVPDAGSLRAAEEILALVKGLGERALVITLISGGGSALLCAPATGADGKALLTLEEKQEVTRALLACGATIQEMNCVRKHLSRIKGGRLAKATQPACSLNLLLSDVVGDELDVIASGPTVPDPTTFADALAVLERHELSGRVPRAALRALEDGAAGRVEETPKPGDAAFLRCTNLLIGTNSQALLAAERKARELGYSPLVLTSRLTGEAREVAQVLFGIGKDIATRGFPLRPPACLIAGGETTVTLRGAGKGGRNQELALAFLAAMGRSPTGCGDLALLAASTDGNDGPTDAAGAFASADLLARSRARGLVPEAFLAQNDSYRFLEAIGALLKTGPTNTNVADIAVLIVRSGAIP
jgi:hydroxypyruvate reductase